MCARGTVSPRQEGTPQGSPLSPLLSNIVLHELNTELHKRGHKFVRYADDCSIYVNSNKSAHRVLESITGYIERVLRLKVNREKTKISRSAGSLLLGFSFYRSKGKYRIRIPLSSERRVQDKIRQLTGRSRPMAENVRISRLESLIAGWVNYFSLADCRKLLLRLDSHVRVRLRMCFWKQWKTIKGRYRHLIKLGVERYRARQWSNTSSGYIRIARSPILCSTLTDEYLRKLGYIGFYQHYHLRKEHQMKLF
ncbi:hypothetical protein HGH93_27500 [Chitinophaga polysaccharea]|uniref:reverse transcriptase domain-containing protein n=1 Tax=Chitinophaga polysaccharea TaxID=1293035 RepID=UPI001455454F|nr:hypothetical protein [Chitinophaga polysaccharea]